MVTTRTTICLGFSTISMFERKRFDTEPPSQPSRSPPAGVLLNETADIKSPGASGALSEQLPVGVPEAPLACGDAIATSDGKVDGCSAWPRKRSLVLVDVLFLPSLGISIPIDGSSGSVFTGWPANIRSRDWRSGSGSLESLDSLGLAWEVLLFLPKLKKHRELCRPGSLTSMFRYACCRSAAENECSCHQRHQTKVNAHALWFRSRLQTLV